MFPRRACGVLVPPWLLVQALEPATLILWCPCPPVAAPSGVGAGHSHPPTAPAAELGPMHHGEGSMQD